jgi:hypothetical protein
MNSATMTANEILANLDNFTLAQLERIALDWEDIFADVSNAAWAKLDAKRGK